MTAQIWDQLAAIGKSAPGAWDELPPDLMAYIDRFDGAEYGLVMIAIKRYAAAAVARERARCSDICDQNASCEGIAQKCAAAIRRG